MESRGKLDNDEKVKFVGPSKIVRLREKTCGPRTYGNYIFQFQNLIPFPNYLQPNGLICIWAKSLFLCCRGNWVNFGCKEWKFCNSEGKHKQGIRFYQTSKNAFGGMTLLTWFKSVWIDTYCVWWISSCIWNVVLFYCYSVLLG